MDLLHGKIKPIYSKYLAASFGSALVGSIFGLVDMASIGQYEGPDGMAAMAVFAPVWNIIIGLGLLAGIGGSVLYGTARGRGETREANEYFTGALILSAVFAAVSWAAFFLFDEQLFRFFGATDELMPVVQAYLEPFKFALPVLVINQVLSAFLRNDGSPGLATASVLIGGGLNVFGDIFFVFTLDMGAFGAGLATALCAALTTVVLLRHFFLKKNTLRLVKPDRMLKRFGQIIVNGFSTFFVDVSMGIITVLLNRQIMLYFGASELAVYGVIVNVSTFVQVCAYSIGQAAQPIISINFGARQGDRIRETLKYALRTVCVFSIAWTVAAMAFPGAFIHLYMSPTDAVLQIAPAIMRLYCLSFILTPLNVFSTYYFQALMKPGAAFFVSVARGLLVSGMLIYAMPLIAGPGALWLAMPITEIIVAAVVVVLMIRYTKQLRTKPEFACEYKSAL